MSVNPWGLELGNTFVIEGGGMITVPPSAIVVGELGALLVIVIIPEYGPAPLGEKAIPKLPDGRVNNGCVDRIYDYSSDELAKA
jgi:hypothetical protein